MPNLYKKQAISFVKMADERLDFMKYVSTRAGEIIMGFWGTDVRARFKDDKSVVTEADERVKDFVQEASAKRFPECGLLTEESEDSRERLSRDGVFIADEIDGSGDFRRGEEDFCFLFAYIEHGFPMIGVVYEPLKERMFFAQKGGKAHLTEKGATRELEPLEPAAWEVSIVGHPKNYKGDKYTKLYKLMGIPEERLMRSGSMGTRMMQVALQQTHMILGYTRNLKEWDIAAGHVILEARGISVTDIQGNPLRYNQPIPSTGNGILVAHHDIKKTTLDKLAKAYYKLPM